MTIQEIKELDNIKYPNNVDSMSFDETQQFIEKHKVNDKFTIITGPVACGKFNQTKADYYYGADHIKFMDSLFYDLKVSDVTGISFVPSDFLFAIKSGKTILIDELNQVPLDIIKMLCDITNSYEYITEKGIIKVHPDFNIIGILTPGDWRSVW